jgi:AcrR family transcriptional regulator
MTHCSVESDVTRVTQEHVDARRDAILGAAAQLFARKGISGATMAEIANEADLSAGAIYRYYSSKEELLRAVFENAAEQNRNTIQTISEHATSPLNALELLGRKAWVEFDNRDDHVCSLQMALSAARDPDDIGSRVVSMRKDLRELLAEMIRNAQAAGEIDPSVNAELLAVIIQACTSGIEIMRLVPQDRFDVEAVFGLFVRMVQGLSPTAQLKQGGLEDNGV